MATRSVLWRTPAHRMMEGTRRSAVSGLRYFSDTKGRILSEEERAAEYVYIQKMEREKLEKMRRKKAEKERAENEKKAGEESQKI